MTSDAITDKDGFMPCICGGYSEHGPWKFKRRCKDCGYTTETYSFRTGNYQTEEALMKREWNDRYIASLAQKQEAAPDAESERDWPEDFTQENGNYKNECLDCTLYFNGNKHRRQCKLCATQTPNTPVDGDRQRALDEMPSEIYASPLEKDVWYTKHAGTIRAALSQPQYVEVEGLEEALARCENILCKENGSREEVFSGPTLHEDTNAIWQAARLYATQKPNSHD